MSQSKCIVVNYATPEYEKGQQRLKESILQYGSEISCMCLNEGNYCVTKHSENPYAFKIESIEHAKFMGFNQILWLDASVYAVKNISPVFKWLKASGIFMEDSGHYVGDWCNDFTLDYFGVTRTKALMMPMFAAGYIGLDFTNPRSLDFFKQWKRSMIDGCFKGSWTDHRHDMSAGSIIAWQMGISYLYSRAGKYFSYVGEGYKDPSETSVFHLQGIA